MVKDDVRRWQPWVYGFVTVLWFVGALVASSTFARVLNVVLVVLNGGLFAWSLRQRRR